MFRADAEMTSHMRMAIIEDDLMMRLPIITLSLLAGLAAIPAAAQQDTSGAEKINQVIVYGDDQCKPSTSDEIVVCNRLPESDRYRVPQIFRGGDPTDPRNEAWANRVVAVERVGRFGTDSCSPVGLGGFTGCTQSMLASAKAERRAANKTDWQTMIAEEREKRVAGIDDAAREVEAAVVAEEKALEQRRQAAADLEAQGNGVIMPRSEDEAALELPAIPPR
jgi:hypothetical protein